MPGSYSQQTIASFLQNYPANSSIIFYACSLEEDYPIVYLSKNVESIFGYAPQAFYEDPHFWMDHIHKDDRAGVASFYDINEHEKYTYTYRFRHKEGHYIWVRDENMLSYDKDKNPQMITGTAFDITLQKKTQQKTKGLNASLENLIKERTRKLSTANRKLKKQIKSLHKAEIKVSKQQKQLKLLRASINHINDMVVLSKAPVEDPLNSKIVFANHAFEGFTGYALTEVEGKSPSILNGPQTQDKLICKVNEAIKQNKTVRAEFKNYKKDGSTYWVELELSPFPAEEQGMQYWVGINRDITQRKRTEKALEENEERYRAYTELAFNAILEFSVDGTITDCNISACKLFKYTKDELPGMNITQLIPKQYQESMPDVLNAGVTTGSKVVKRTYRKRDGSTFPAEISTKFYKRDEEDHLIAYVRDISEQASYQKALEKSLAEKNILLAEVHHRVKNNLAVISGLLEMQIFNAVDPQVVQAIRESQARIQSIATVHEMLYKSASFSNIKLGDYINELLNYLISTFEFNNKNIEIKKDIAPVSLTVKQAVPCGLLLNELITNAYKHAFSETDEGVISISLRKNEDTVCLKLEDNGTGLPEDFDIHSTSSLGMSLIQTLVKQLEGHLSIANDQGACFTIDFKIQA